MQIIIIYYVNRFFKKVLKINLYLELKPYKKQKIYLYIKLKFVGVLILTQMNNLVIILYKLFKQNGNLFIIFYIWLQKMIID